ncbi:MAG: UrcA family protein [Sphingomonadales bacterium]
MNRKLHTIAILCAASALCTAVPAHAQSGVEEIIVEGRNEELPESARSATQAVSYADLDLSTEAGKKELRHRVNLTARFLCDKLGQSATTSVSAVPSCREAAVKDAMERVGTAEENAVPRGTAWVAPPAWQAPYPSSWAQTYPGE